MCKISINQKICEYAITHDKWDKCLCEDCNDFKEPCNNERLFNPKRFSPMPQNQVDDKTFKNMMNLNQQIKQEHKFAKENR